MKDDLETMAQQLRADSYVAYKPTPKPAELRTQIFYGCEPIFSQIIMDSRRSPLIEKSAKRILDRKLRPLRVYGPSVTTLRLFDAYEGMPDGDKDRDLNGKGDFASTSLTRVKVLRGDGLNAVYRQVVIPSTFAGLKSSQVKLVHIELDLYQPILDALDFCCPRSERGKSSSAATTARRQVRARLKWSIDSSAVGGKWCSPRSSGKRWLSRSAKGFSCWPRLPEIESMNARPNLERISNVRSGFGHGKLGSASKRNRAFLV